LNVKKKNEVERKNVLCLNVGNAEVSLKHFSDTNIFLVQVLQP